MFVRLRIAACFLAVIAFMPSLAVAQDDEAEHRFAGDLYRAGADVHIDEGNIEDLYAAGETITVDTNVRESVHAAGRRIRLNRAIGDDVYVAGYAIDIGGAVQGDVTAAGYRVELGAAGSIGQDALLAGRSVYVRGAVAGDANLAGETVELSGPISGSVEIHASEIRFTDDARIDGTLTYWSPTTINVPATVIAPGRVTGHLIEDVSSRGGFVRGFVRGLLAGLLFLMLIGALFALLFPRTLTRAQSKLSAKPWSGLLLGAVAVSALFGAMVVLGASIIGIPLVLLVALAVPFILMVGYLTAAYVLGHLALGLIRVKLVEGRLAALGSVLVGLVLLLIIGLIPILGWIVLVFATLFGIGALGLVLLDRYGQGANAASA